MNTCGTTTHGGSRVNSSYATIALVKEPCNKGTNIQQFHTKQEVYLNLELHDSDGTYKKTTRPIQGLICRFVKEMNVELGNIRIVIVYLILARLDSKHCN